MLKAVRSICIVTGDHLWRNPRVVKEADALTRAGFHVAVVGPVVSAADNERDLAILNGRAWTRIGAPDLLAGGAAKRFLGRLSRRLQVVAVRRLGLQLSGALGYGIGETVQVAAALKADLYACHQEPGLAAYQRLAARGLRCSVDFEDWYSADLIGEARKARPAVLLQRLEKQALHEAVFCTTTSQALAGAFVAAYGGREPGVVYNAFERLSGSPPAGMAPERLEPSRPSLCWFSQTIGPGRGLEILFDAFGRVKGDCELHLRGDGHAAYFGSLLARLEPAAAARVAFHGTTSPALLPWRIAEHDIGLALELTTPPSRDLTITNKVFQFLQGGCAIIASRTAGQEEAARHFPAAITLTELEPEALASAIDSLLADPAKLARARKAARAAGDGPASWEQVSEGLVRRFREAVG